MKNDIQISITLNVIEPEMVKESKELYHFLNKMFLLTFLNGTKRL